MVLQIKLIRQKHIVFFLFNYFNLSHNPVELKNYLFTNLYYSDIRVEFPVFRVFDMFGCGYKK